MRGGRRLAIAIGAAGLALAPVPLAAQDPPGAPANSTAPAETVGPRELQNFSLSGTVTRPAEPPTQPTQGTRPARESARTAERAGTATVASERANRPARTADAATRAPAPSSEPPQRQVELTLPPPTSAPPIRPLSSIPAVEPAGETGGMAPEQRIPGLPWLLAAAMLAAGLAFLFWRNRSRAATASGPKLDLFSPPEPPPPAAPRRPVAPPPTAAPAARRGSPLAPEPLGIVSSGLRGWLELGMQPARCIVEDHQVTIEFQLDLFNSGSAPVRSILVEAVVLNAGAAQDQEVGAFFAKPAGAGDRIEVIPPLQRMTLATKVVTAREHVRTLEIAGRQVFVPLVAFNAHYRAGSGKGQTSVGYLIGRDGKGDKLAPFRLDLGPRVFRGLGARPLPDAVRT